MGRRKNQLKMIICSFWVVLLCVPSSRAEKPCSIHHRLKQMFVVGESGWNDGEFVKETIRYTFHEDEDLELLRGTFKELKIHGVPIHELKGNQIISATIKRENLKTGQVKTEDVYGLVNLSPSHQKMLENYYKTLKDKRHFAEDRMNWIKSAESDLSMKDTEVYRIFNAYNTETYSGIRLQYGDKQNPIPYEIAMQKRGLESLAMKEFRKNSIYRFHTFIEVGKAFRSKGIRGEYGKAIWNLQVCEDLLERLLYVKSHHNDVFIHVVDAAGARLYQKAYGAEVLERIDLVDGKSVIRSPRAPLPKNFAQSEYFMRVKPENWIKNVLESFISDPGRSKLLGQSDALKRKLQKVQSDWTRFRDPTDGLKESPIWRDLKDKYDRGEIEFK